MRFALLAIAVACGSPEPKPIANVSFPPPNDRLLPVAVRGTVLDYSGHPVKGAIVRVTSGNTSIQLETDARGEFTLRAPKGAYVSAGKDDMLGSAQLGSPTDQTIVIKMTQMPL
jgi:carboxypeptidase family protein